MRAQGGHEGEKVETSREGSVEKEEEANPMQDENHTHVEPTHDVVAKVLVFPNRQRTTPPDGARPSTSVACSHQSSAGNARLRTD